MGNLKDTAAGPDDITNEILKLLPEASLRTILAIINHIWKSRSFPEEWREATIIPIPKPGKDHSDPNNYRPLIIIYYRPLFPLLAASVNSWKD